MISCKHSRARLSRWHLRRNDGICTAALHDSLSPLFDRFAPENGATPPGSTDMRNRRRSKGTGGGARPPDLCGFCELPRSSVRSLSVTVEDLSYGQTARSWACDRTVMSRLSRGREKLRRYLSGERSRSNPAGKVNDRSPGPIGDDELMAYVDGRLPSDGRGVGPISQPIRIRERCPSSPSSGKHSSGLREPPRADPDRLRAHSSSPTPHARATLPRSRPRFFLILSLIR